MVLGKETELKLKFQFYLIKLNHRATEKVSAWSHVLSPPLNFFDFNAAARLLPDDRQVQIFYKLSIRGKIPMFDFVRLLAYVDISI